MWDLIFVLKYEIIFGGIPGALVALLMLCIPVVRCRLGENGSARIRIALGSALLAFVVFYVGGAHFDAYVVYDFVHRELAYGGDGTIVGDYPDRPVPRLEDNKSALIRELWLINMTPGSLYQPCYTRD